MMAKQGDGFISLIWTDKEYIKKDPVDTDHPESGNLVESKKEHR